MKVYRLSVICSPGFLELLTAIAKMLTKEHLEVNPNALQYMRSALVRDTLAAEIKREYQELADEFLTQYDIPELE